MKTPKHKVTVKRRGQGSALPAAIATGAAVSILSALLLVALESTLLDKRLLPVDQVDKLSIFIWILSAAAGCFLSSAVSKEKKLIATLGSCGVYVMILLLLSGICFQARYGSVGKGCCIILAAALAVGFATARPKKMKTQKKRFR